MNLLQTNRVWFWPSEVAIICRVSKSTVYNWIESGVLIPVLTRRPYKIPRTEIEKLLSK